MHSVSASRSLAITNPLILYRSLIATKKIEPDPAQHRLAIHLQKVHERLKDYYPDFDFRERLNHIRSLVGSSSEQPFPIVGKQDEVFPAGKGLWATWRRRSRDSEVTALTERLTDLNSAAILKSPQGLLLHGEVGTGKSLLTEILGECLPGDRVQRWHYNAFMLSIYSQIEKLRKSNATSSYDEYALLRLSRDLVFQSPILLIDEFQFPDRAASKILSNLLTSFFQLGGVLIATSNRMPEQLADAAGFDFSANAVRHNNKSDRTHGNNWTQRQGARTLAGGDFESFLTLLKARCEIWNIEGSRDWRRRDMKSVQSDGSVGHQTHRPDSGPEALDGLDRQKLGLGCEQSRELSSSEQDSLHGDGLQTNLAPPYYFVKKSQNDLDEQQRSAWARNEARAAHELDPSPQSIVRWMPDSIQVYGRLITVPRQCNGVTKWSFDELCAVYLGSADYISLASSFHTFIITDVPILTLHHKNEARRFITLLDALYEARCKLLISSEARPDHILFPERLFQGNDDVAMEKITEDLVYSETFSEIHQDQTMPFRSNVSAYFPSASEPDYPLSPVQIGHPQSRGLRSMLADEDSDFGPVWDAGRSQGRSFALKNTHQQGESTANEPDFSRVETFTGQDEMFAYKRAESRLWEMCSERWWSQGIETWRPLAKKARHWETDGRAASEAASLNESPRLASDDDLFPRESSPFRRSEKPPPRFNWTHAWGMTVWGKKAGPWGQGPQGLADRKSGE